MNFKDFGLREWLVIIFIILGLAAFVFEDYFKPKIYEAEGVGIGYNDDITLKVKAYKKKDKTIRVTEIEVKHGDTDEIGGVALQKLVDDVKDLKRTGFIHIAFSVGSKEKVDELTEMLKEDGYEVISGPRTTGDGYYESCIVGIEGNQIEITV